MRIFLQLLNEWVRQVVLNGWTTPTKEGVHENGTKTVKLIHYEKWTKVHKSRSTFNAKALRATACAFSKDEFRRMVCHSQTGLGHLRNDPWRNLSGKDIQTPNFSQPIMKIIKWRKMKPLALVWHFTSIVKVKQSLHFSDKMSHQMHFNSKLPPSFSKKIKKQPPLSKKKIHFPIQKVKKIP